MSNGGEIASRGFIFQAVVALIECLDPDNDWDQIKNEPNTDEDKVDIMLYKDGKSKSAIQVKSSINAFERADVEKWLKKLKYDAKEAENVCLYLVGDTFTPSCENFIKENPDEIKKVPFEHLQRISTGTLAGYINRVGLGEKVRVTDLDLIDASLFSEILRNSIAKEPVSRGDFEAAFQRAIPQGEELTKQIAEALARVKQKGPKIPSCLTPIPLIDKKTGLVGRDDIVKEIRKMLDENSCIVLVNGLGGIGKTAVMQGICNELKDEGHHVAWISCGDSLQDDLLMLRDGMKVMGEEKAEETYRIVKSRIQDLGKDLYLFMDDLSREVSKEERNTINGLGVHVMITSRAENLPFPKKRMEYLDEDSAVRMFFGYYDEESGDEEAARKIVRSVNSHTLLVELLAKAAKEEGGNLDEFYKKLEKNGFFNVSEEALDVEHDDENLTIEESVIRLYKISDLSEEQKRIMKLFTVFSPEKEIYYKIREWAGFDRKEMKGLVDLGWIDRGGLENGYYIHQIVRDSIARQMEKNGEKVNLEDYGDFVDNIIDTGRYLGREVTHELIRERLVLTDDVARFFVENGRVDAAVGTLFNGMTGVLDAQGKFRKAQEYCQKALEIREQVLGPNNTDTAATYCNIAWVFYRQGEYKKALEYYEKALEIYKHVLGPDHPDTAITYNDMVGVFYQQGEYGKALEYCQKALAIVERALGPDHPDTGATYNNMAGVFIAQGEYGKALEYCEKALATYKQVLGLDHPYIAMTYNTKAWVLYKQGEYRKSLESYETALAICERTLGLSHPQTGMTYNDMAGLFFDQGEFGKALEYYKKALSIRERVLGPDHPDTGVTYNNMGMVFYKQGKYGKALEYYRKSLAIRERILGQDHPDTEAIYRIMAKILLKQGKFKEALECFVIRHTIYFRKEKK